MPTPIVDEKQPPKGKVASTPEEAFEFFQDAVKAEDVNATAEQLRGGGLAVFEMVRAADVLRDAIKEKLGKDAEKLLSARQYLAAKKKNERTEVRSKSPVDENVVKLVVWEFTTENAMPVVKQSPYFAVREAGRWKIDFLSTMSVKSGKDEEKVNGTHRLIRLEGDLPKDWTKERDYQGMVEGRRIMMLLADEVRAGKLANEAEVFAEMQRLEQEFQRRIDD